VGDKRKVLVIRAQAILIKNPSSATLYVAIPADMVKDSQFPFIPNEKVDLEIKPNDGTIVISSEGWLSRSITRKLDEEEKSRPSGKMIVTRRKRAR
jgi:hypothetical protein